MSGRPWKLGPKDVEEIIDRLYLYRENAPKVLAGEFGVSHWTIRKVWQCHKRLLKSHKQNSPSDLTPPTLNISNAT